MTAKPPNNPGDAGDEIVVVDLKTFREKYKPAALPINPLSPMKTVLDAYAECITIACTALDAIKHNPGMSHHISNSTLILLDAKVKEALKKVLPEAKPPKN